MFTLPELPFGRAALEPHMSSETLDFHYGKHHKTYVDNLNKLIAGSELENDSLEDIIKKTAGDETKTGIFNNAAQHFNHDFFWKGLKPDGKNEPSADLATQIKKDFGSLEIFRTEFKAAAVGLFGSGWVWLVLDNGKLSILKTANGDNPAAHDKKPLWALDVWEHAYYLDYQNRRADYVEAVLSHLINWDFVSKNL